MGALLNTWNRLVILGSLPRLGKSLYFHVCLNDKFGV